MRRKLNEEDQQLLFVFFYFIYFYMGYMIVFHRYNSQSHYIQSSLIVSFHPQIYNLFGGQGNSKIRCW